MQLSEEASQLLLSFSARELELEDRQRRLQQELRGRMSVDGKLRRHVLQAVQGGPGLLLHLLSLLMASADRFKDQEQLLEEREILEEMLEVVEQREALASLLEVQRAQELRPEQELQEVLLREARGACWSSTRRGVS